MVRAVLKSYRKNILREMKDNLSRMVSLFGIVALGVMMLTGLMSFAPRPDANIMNSDNIFFFIFFIFYPLASALTPKKKSIRLNSLTS